MTQRSYAILLLFIALALFFVPLVMPTTLTQAQSQFIGDTLPGGIVPCGDPTDTSSLCGLCDLVALAQESLNFAVYFTVFVATLLFVYAGFLYITAAGDSGQISTATKIFGKVVAGLVIVLVAWLVVDTILKTFFQDSPLNQGFGPWNTIQCGFSAPFNEDTGLPANPVTPVDQTLIQAARARLQQQSTVETSLFDTSNADAAHTLEQDCAIAGGTYSKTCQLHGGLECGTTIHMCSGWEGVSTSGGGVSVGGGGTTGGVAVLPSGQLTHNQALSLLESAGIVVTSTSGQQGVKESCPTKDGCTSLTGLKRATLDQVLNINQVCSGCSIAIVGATEPHEVGTFSHQNGYKVDIQANQKVDDFFDEHLIFSKLRTGSNAGAVYLDSCGNEYVRENNNHWDITVKTTCSL